MNQREIVLALRKIRQENRMSQDAVAASIGKSLHTILAYEKGYPDYSPHVNTLASWAEVLGYEIVLQPKVKA